MTITTYKNTATGKDARISSANPNQNAGTGSSLDIRTFASGDARRALVGFNLADDTPISGDPVPVGAIVNSATLRIRRGNLALNSDVAAKCFLINQMWTETGVTWNNQPTTLASPSVDWTSLAAGGVDVDINVTPLVQLGIDADQYDGGGPGDGPPTMLVEFLLKLATEAAADAGQSYLAREIGDGREPELIVDWSTPREIANPPEPLIVTDDPTGAVAHDGTNSIRFAVHNIEDMPNTNPTDLAARATNIRNGYTGIPRPDVLVIQEMHSANTLTWFNDNVVPWKFQHRAVTNYTGIVDNFNATNNPTFTGERGKNEGILSRLPFAVTPEQITFTDPTGVLSPILGLAYFAVDAPNGARVHVYAIHVVPDFNNPTHQREREDHMRAVIDDMTARGINPAVDRVLIMGDLNQAENSIPSGEQTIPMITDLGFIDPMSGVPESVTFPTSCTWWGQSGTSCQQLDFQFYSSSVPMNRVSDPGAVEGTGRTSGDTDTQISDHHMVGSTVDLSLDESGGGRSRLRSRQR